MKTVLLKALLLLWLAGALGCGPAETVDASPPSAGEYETALEQAHSLLAKRSPDALEASLAFWQAAIEAEPARAPARSGRAVTLALLALQGTRAPAGTLDEAVLEAHRALDLDAESAQAWAAVGLTDYLGRFAWQSAEAAFLRAFEKDPSYAAPLHWYAMLLSATGHHDAAIDRIDRAFHLEPDRALYAIKAATLRADAGQLDEAESRLLEAARRWPSSAMVKRELGNLALRRGELAQARDHFEEALVLAPDHAMALAGRAHADALLGDKEKALEVRSRLSERARSQWLSPVALAIVDAGLGDSVSALERLEIAFATHDPAIVYLKTRPGLAPLREEAGFLDLVDRLGLSD